MVFWFYIIVRICGERKHEYLHEQWHLEQKANNQSNGETFHCIVKLLQYIHVYNNKFKRSNIYTMHAQKQNTKRWSTEEEITSTWRCNRHMVWSIYLDKCVCLLWSPWHLRNRQCIATRSNVFVCVCVCECLCNIFLLPIYIL